MSVLSSAGQTTAPSISRADTKTQSLDTPRLAKVIDRALLENPDINLRSALEFKTHIRHFNGEARGINSKNSQVSFGRPKSTGWMLDNGIEAGNNASSNEIELSPFG
jgi:hypothetical protein